MSNLVILITVGEAAVGTVIGIAVVTFVILDGALVTGAWVVGVPPHINHDDNIVTLYVWA